MGDVIYLAQDQAAAMTNCKELIKLYRRKDPKKFEDAIEKKMAVYDTIMAEVLGR
jgi:hypothetical protein